MGLLPERHYRSAFDRIADFVADRSSDVLKVRFTDKRMNEERSVSATELNMFILALEAHGSAAVLFLMYRPFLEERSTGGELREQPVCGILRATVLYPSQTSQNVVVAEGSDGGQGRN